MDLQQRIAQFENMAHADPDNEMAHYSLGSAYAEAERHADAAESFLRCIGVNAEMSKAYQLAAENLIKAGDPDRASEVLDRGYEIATLKGDLMPKRAMEGLYDALGKQPPEIKGAPEPAIPADGDFTCQLTGRPGTQLDDPPFRGPIGAWIRDNISAESWRDWIGQGTKVINELRLDLSREEDAATYDKYMREYLGLTDDLVEKIESGQTV